MHRGNLKFKSCDEDYLLDMNFSSVPFHTINLILPSSQNFLDGYKDILTSSENDYFIVKKISASALIEEAFLQNFLRKGSLSAISNNLENIDKAENCVAITETGKLVIVLENNIADYLSLLKEKKYNPQKETQTHKVCIIEINSQDFEPGNKFYDSVALELKKIDHIKFDLLLKWKPEGNICCGSVRDYFESQDLECLTCESFHKQETSFSVKVPKLNFHSMIPSLAENFLEWIGVQLCGINTDETDVFANAFDHTEVISRLLVSTCQGFYTSEDIHKLLKRARSFFTEDPNMPFVALIFSGYQHCYIDDKDFENISSSDKIICILISPQYDYWIIRMNM